MAERCPATTMGTQCELDAGHNSPHRSDDEAAKMTWEPSYVGDLRRALRDAQEDPWRFHLKEVLDAIGPELTCDAIKDANEALDQAEARDEAIGVT